MKGKPTDIEVANLNSEILGREAVLRNFPEGLIRERMQAIATKHGEGDVPDFRRNWDKWPEEDQSEYRRFKEIREIRDGEKLIDPVDAYAAKARSNLFKVRDRDAFDALLSQIDWPLETFSGEEDDGLVGVIVTNEILGGWPTDAIVRAAPGAQPDDDFFALVSRHLAAGEVAVFVEVGGYCLEIHHLTDVFARMNPENTLAIGGYSIAINSEAQRVRVDLDEAYEQARRLSPKKLRPRPVAEATLAEYEEFVKLPMPESAEE